MATHALITMLGMQEQGAWSPGRATWAEPASSFSASSIIRPFPFLAAWDATTIVLAASQKSWWLYYALMATAGALLGGYITYRLALKLTAARSVRREGRYKRNGRPKSRRVDIVGVYWTRRASSWNY